MFEKFPINKSYNLAGLLGFKFQHRNSVAVYPGVFDNKVLTPLEFFPNLSWLDGYATKATLTFREESMDGPNGKYYQQEITGFAPGDRHELISLMEKMDSHEFLLQIKDSAGQNRLVGSHGYPLLFSSVYNSGATIDQAKGYNFKFAGTSIFRAPVYL